MNKPTADKNRLIEFFGTMVKRGVLSQQDQADYNAQKRQFNDDEIYICKQLTGTTGTVTLVDENDVREVGKTNLSKGSVPLEKNLIIGKIGVAYGYSATQVDAAMVEYSNAIYSLNDTVFDAGSVATGDTVNKRFIPLEVENAEYEMKCDGIIVDSGRISDMLTRNITNDAVGGDDKNFKVLEWPKLLLAGKRVECEIKYPKQATQVAGYHYLRLSVKGIALGKRAAL